MIAAADALWYAVHTHPHEERKALTHLRRQRFEAYLPSYAKRIRHARRTQRVLRPLFPRYLFVSLNLAAGGWRAIRSTLGVADIVRFGDQPTPLPAGVVEDLMSREDAEGCISLAQQDYPKPGDPVVILDGPFARLHGLCERMTDNERVAVLLELLGRKVRVLLDADTVEAA